MNKELNIGEEVLIFRYIPEWGLNQDFEHYIIGNVVKSETSSNLSYHGSPWCTMNYTVLGEDGKKYFGNYINPTLGNSFFMKQEDYIYCLERKIANSQEKISKINEENQRIKKMIETIQIRENHKETQLIRKNHRWNGENKNMKNDLDLEYEIKVGQENAKKTKELYELLSSYNAYNILLLNAKKEYERGKANLKQYYSNSECYKEQIADLFALFKDDEFLTEKLISRINDKDMLFLIDKDTLLRMNSFDIINSNIAGLSNIDYNLLKIKDCKALVYKKRVYCRNPYYCDEHYEEQDAFGLFCGDKLVTPVYQLDSQSKIHDNMDIREILKPQSIDEIHEKITRAKNIKVKKLVLTK